MSGYMAAAISPNSAPEDSYLVIQPGADGDGVHLVLYTRDVFVGDSWHDQVSDAQRFALEEYDVKPSDWHVLEDIHNCHEAMAAIKNIGSS